MMDISSNVNEACRLCLRGEGKINVFEDDVNTKGVTAENVYECVSVKITKYDKLPRGICDECLLSVESWCAFKSKCDETQKILYGWLGCDNLTDKNLSGDKPNISNQLHEHVSSKGTIQDSTGEQVGDLSLCENIDLNLKDKSTPRKEAVEVSSIDEVKKPSFTETVNNEVSIPVSNMENNPALRSISLEEKTSDLNSNSSRKPCDDVPGIDEPTVEGKSGFSSDNDLNVNNNCSIVDSTEKVVDEISVNTCKISTLRKSADSINIDAKSENIPCSADDPQKKLKENNKSDVIKHTTSKNELEVDNIPERVSDLSSADITKGESAHVESGINSEDSNSAVFLTDISSDSDFVQLVSDSQEKQEADNTNNFPSKNKEKINEEICKEDDVVFTAAVTIDVNPFPDVIGSESSSSELIESNSSSLGSRSNETTNSQRATESNDEAKKSDETILLMSDVEEERGTVSSTGLPCGEKLAEEEVSSSVEKQRTTGLHFLKKKENEPEDTSNLSSHSPVQSEVAPVNENDCEVSYTSMDARVKEEPIDSTTDDITQEPQSQVRVKSEFRGFHYEEDLYDEQSSLGTLRPNFGAVNPDDPMNTECFICNRKYSSVSNYRAHLQTKLHLFNSGHPVDQPPPSSKVSQVQNIKLESPLLRSRLSTDPHCSYLEPPISKSPIPFSVSPVPKRKIVDHCNLCNTSFTHLSELRKHVLSKKHRLNEKLARMGNSSSHFGQGYSEMRASFPETTRSTLQKGRSPLSETHLQRARFDSYSRNQSPKDLDAEESGSGKSIFICPIQYCNFSCRQGDVLLNHMKLHGIGEPHQAGENVSAKPKLSLRQQDMIKREAEMKQKEKIKKEAEMRQREMMKREAEMRQREVLRREIEMKQKELMRREAEMRKEMQRREAEAREAEMRKFQEHQRLIQEQHGHFMLQKSEPIAEYKCKGCQKLFIRESGLKKHTWYCTALMNTEVKKESAVNVLDDDEDSESSVSHCPLCAISFTNKKIFVNHVQIYHKGSFLESSVSTSPVISITKRNIEKPAVKQKAPPLQKVRITNKTHGFTCDICGKKFNLLSSFNFHLKSHTVSVKHICRICKEPFNNRKSFMEHCRSHFMKPGSKETLCHKCFKVFKTRSELYYHKKNDLCSIRLKLYSCSICEHSFKDPADLEEHKVRVHSESLDISEDNEHDSPKAEIYDSELPVNPLDLLAREDEDEEEEEKEEEEGKSKPGTSFKKDNYILKNPVVYADKLPLQFIVNATKSRGSNSPASVRSGSSYNSNPAPPLQKHLQCEVCPTRFSSKQALRKHTLVFHILNKPYSGSRNYKKYNRGSHPNQPNQWKCKHCKQAFKTRKGLVHHLKKCTYSTLDDTKGLCLQCGKSCESGKTRICRFCLPKGVREPIDSTVDHQSLSPDPQSSKTGFRGFSDPDIISSQNRTFLHGSNQEIKEDSNVSRPTHRNKHPRSIDDVILMKCPVGNKYFRTESIMVKHYAQCDGSCENRCSHCRKSFNSPKEYKFHLVYSRCFGPNRDQTKKKSKMKYPTFACKKKKVRRPLVDQLRDDISDVTVDTSTYSEETTTFDVESNSSINKAVEEKCLKLRRVCSLCNRVITTQRGIYRHTYTCSKTFFHHQESVSCSKCQKTFSKLQSMKENASAFKQHVLECHFVPYYNGEGFDEEGNPLNVPPDYLCYICSFGFSSHQRLMAHIKAHRNNKDEINNIVLQLEDELLSDERMTDENSMFGLYLKPVESGGSIPVYAGRVLSLNPLAERKPSKLLKYYECDKCCRRFTNHNKFLRHKRVHGIISENVYKAEEASEALNIDDVALLF